MYVTSLIPYPRPQRFHRRVSYNGKGEVNSPTRKREAAGGLLGHKHLDSTQRYTRVNAHELRRAIKRLRRVG
jgi:hypothetical protein